MMSFEWLLRMRRGGRRAEWVKEVKRYKLELKNKEALKLTNK